MNQGQTGNGLTDIHLYCKYNSLRVFQVFNVRKTTPIHHHARRVYPMRFGVETLNLNVTKNRLKIRRALHFG